MLDFIFILVSIFLNVFCIWTVRIMLKYDEKVVRKMYATFALAAISGVILSYFFIKQSFNIQVIFSLLGASVCEVVALFFISIKQFYHKETVISYYDDGSSAKYYITGDKHRNFSKVKSFCRDMETRRRDVLIILGDAGFNYYNDKRDDSLKADIASLNITLFCIHGNKENRPQNIGTYGIRNFCGGKVYYEPRYPNILFAIDGEIYTFEGRKYMVAGGAHSVDKLRCLENGEPFWNDEMPNEQIKSRVEKRLRDQGYKIHGMLTHTCPMNYLPTEMFMSVKQSTSDKRKGRKTKPAKTFKADIDRSTEIWLGKIEKKLYYNVWFCGHYHIDKKIDKIQMMCSDIRPLHIETFNNDDKLYC